MANLKYETNERLEKRAKLDGILGIVNATVAIVYNVPSAIYFFAQGKVGWGITHVALGLFVGYSALGARKDELACLEELASRQKAMQTAEAPKALEAGRQYETIDQVVGTVEEKVLKL